MFSSINVIVGSVTASLKGYVTSKWLDLQGWFKPRFAFCKATVETRTARARLAAKDCYDRARVATIPHVVTVRERVGAAVDSIRPRARALADKVVAICRAVTAWFEMSLHLTLAGKWIAPIVRLTDRAVNGTAEAIWSRIPARGARAGSILVAKACPFVAIGAGRRLAVLIVAVVLDSLRATSRRVVGRAAAAGHGLAFVASVPLALLAAHAAFAAVGAIGLAVIKLSLLVMAADILIGTLPGLSRTGLRGRLRVAIAGGLASISFAAATVGTALDPGPTTPAVTNACATPATSLVVVAHDVAVVPEQEAPAPTHPAERRTRQRMTGSNGRA
jgi:hypothetical protein